MQNEKTKMHINFFYRISAFFGFIAAQLTEEDQIFEDFMQM